jgi:glycosyltransferase involved in cell wall biosynthesis
MEILPLIRRLLPAASIVMTLHDYYAICANDGQMHTVGGLPCARASIDACRRCFPDRAATDFRLRDIQVTGALRAVDRFIAPSEFLRQRFIEWGISAERIGVIRNGLPRHMAAPARRAPDGRRDRFGFFGHINRFKGATLALEASARLSRNNIEHQLLLHGGSTYQTQETMDHFNHALQDAPDALHLGAYSRAEQAALMADVDWVVVPSVWWENAPLVIQEAFAHGRPVICANVGGMAEAVRDGVDGLHFTRGNPRSLEQAMRRAIEEPELWQRLAANIVTPRGIEVAADEHLDLYQDLIAQAPARRSAA